MWFLWYYIWYQNQVNSRHMLVFKGVNLFFLYRTLNQIRYHEGLLGQRLGKKSQLFTWNDLISNATGPVNCLKFHPNLLQLAAASTDSYVSLYGYRRYWAFGFADNCEMWKYLGHFPVSRYWENTSLGVLWMRRYYRRYYAYTWETAIEAEILPCTIRLKCAILNIICALHAFGVTYVWKKTLNVANKKYKERPVPAAYSEWLLMKLPFDPCNWMIILSCEHWALIRDHSLISGSVAALSQNNSIK